MASFAELIAKELGHATPTKEKLNITRTDRYDLFKIGPVLSISVSFVPMVTACVKLRRIGGEEASTCDINVYMYMVPKLLQVL